MDDNLDYNDRLNLLAQKKSLCFLFYGEGSYEFFNSIKDLGVFYNLQNRPESAIRHLSRASSLASRLDLTEEDNISLAIEIADAHIKLNSSNKKDRSNQIRIAKNTISPYSKANTSNETLNYRLNLILAKIKSYYKDHDSASTLFNKAIDHLINSHNGKETSECAKLYFEIAKFSESNGGNQLAKEMYERAYQSFIRLKMVESASIARTNLEKFPSSTETSDENMQETYGTSEISDHVIEEEDDLKEESIIETSHENKDEQSKEMKTQSDQIDLIDLESSSTSDSISFSISKSSLSEQSTDNFASSSDVGNG
ncbi:hypothetical protein GPJ56_010478 [Histomonas meleagridis]|uniref:uncharacterized protein n=1 Tax=Histomonas meleagridis TaxID=135588 RepID=UPI0035595D54|nr:hypothetical protein GPJ56_010478 [Histomonas meleagridis]KAH0798045.1 hypothetical protein GO595_009158 [Histomonas meleagridis]